MNLRLPFLAAAMLCVSGVASAQSSPESYGFEGRLIFWKPSPEIVLTSGTLGTPVDFINTLGVEEKRFRSYQIVTKAGKHKVRFSKENIKYDATTELPVTIRFQGQTYTVGVPTTAELDWHLTRIGYEWDPVSTPRGFLGLVFDLEYNKMNVQLSAPGVTTEIFEGAPAPEPGQEVIDTATFAEVDGRTRLTLLVSCPSREVRDMIVASGMEDGLQDALDLLDELTVTLR